MISGGLNIYPQETDDVLALHPAVADVACVGAPHDDLGEVLTAVVELLPGDTINIPAHQKHRVEWTSPNKPTVWLAVFYW